MLVPLYLLNYEDQGGGPGGAGGHGHTGQLDDGGEDGAATGGEHLGCGVELGGEDAASLNDDARVPCSTWYEIEIEI